MAEQDYLGGEEYKVIGKRPIRHDGTEKVTGRARYGADVHPTGWLEGKTLRSPHAHALIVKIDTSKAEALEGVKAVVTSKDMLSNYDDKVTDLGEGTAIPKNLANNVLASEKVLYEGHAVAAVAATSGHIADEAIQLIEVEYEVLPPVIDVVAATKDASPLLHEEMQTKSLGEQTDKHSNVANHFQHVFGDPDKGFAEADHVIEREFKTETVHQGYLEPHSVTAVWERDGKLTCWLSSQGPFEVRGQLSDLLGIPVNDIKVVPQEIGGGFGGKFRVYQEPTAALLSKATGQPVKMVMSRTEVLKATGPTPGSFIRCKMGCKNDGTLVAAKADMYYEAGAYPGSAVGAGAGCIFSPFNIPNTQIDGYDVVVNKPQSAAYRAPGATNAAFASETVLDELAEAIGMDPLEMRLKNASKEGTRRADGPVFLKIGCEEVVQAAMETEHYKSKLEGPNKGRGVATGFWFNGGGASSVIASLNPDGSVGLIEGSTDIGGTRTSIAMQFAEGLGISVDQVKPNIADTDSVPHTDGTGGSRVTFATGLAGYHASQDMKRNLIARAAMIWEIAEDDVDYKDGEFSSKSDPNEKMSFKELAAQSKGNGGTVTGRASVQAKNPGNAYACMIVDVDVDPDTGKVEIERATLVQDVGTAIHPSYVEGQMQGGVAQGVGWALNEEFFYNSDGVMMNASLLDYRMPTALDLPMIETVLVEVPNPNHPYGVRGVGEVPIVPPPAAIANAIYRAIGVRMENLPMSPGKVLEAIWAKGDGAAQAAD
ncbi:TPA: oxidoreductase [Candidatus Latescibacteria bacterium]|nr:oxidoreductase [Candidatus Latescibacterota bacterium]